MPSRATLLRLLVQRGIAPAKAARLLDEALAHGVLWDEAELAELAWLPDEGHEAAREWVAYSPDVPDTSRRLWTALLWTTVAAALYRNVRAYAWDASKLRFVTTSNNAPVRIVSDLRRLHTNAVQRFGALAVDTATGQLDPVTFARVVAQELRNLYDANAALAWGGWARTPAAAFARNADLLVGEYRYLANFARDLAEGRVSAEQAVARMALYIGKAYSRYWDEQLLAVQETGAYTEYLWLDTKDERECADCPQYAAQGWVNVGTFGTVPGAGDTQCLGACRCELEYR